MTHPMTRLATLKRPKLLVRAARIGLQEFNRERSLRRVFQDESYPGPGQAFEKLLAIEAAVDNARRHGGGLYSPARHVEILTALINEAQLADLRLAA